ncbi:MAG: porin family protein [Chlorobiaceae bacterium]|nr:porin family protein [Chlorobiaceae bacterium]
MKKTYSLLIAALGLTLLAAPLQASDRYASLFGGVSKINDGTLDAGLTATAALGCDYGTSRVEAELGYQNNGVKNSTSDVRLVSLMGNGYYDIDLGGVDLYGTAGVGVAESGHQTDVAYQFGAGLAVPIGDKVMLDARYRYFTTIVNPSLSSNSGLLGLRITF